MRAARFVDNDDGYLAWKATHPRGLVLNCERSPRAASLMLHRANCRSLEALPPGYVHWTKDYVKVCSDTAAAIDEWISESVPGGAAQRCQLCEP